MLANVGWGIAILLLGVLLCVVSFQALFRTKLFITRMTHLAYGPEPPADKVRRRESARYIVLIRLFPGLGLLFLGVMSFIAAAESFVTAVK